MPAIELHAHEALFYEDERAYRRGLAHFLAPALAEDEPIALVLPRPKLDLIKDLVDEASSAVLLDMAEVGRNPGRLIALLERLLHEHPGEQLHFVGEPVWPKRDAEETLEAVRHEALLNAAFQDSAVRILCPYDARLLDRNLLEFAELTHPDTVVNGTRRASGTYQAGIPSACESDLAVPPDEALMYDFREDDLARMRGMLRQFARAAGTHSEALDDVQTVANELVGNAVKHGAPPRRMSLWRGDGTVVCQVESRGEISDPLAGRHRAETKPGRGLGLFIVHQLSNLVQIRTGHTTKVRAHVPAGSG